MKKRIYKYFLFMAVLTVPALIVSCSGGGGGGDDPAAPEVYTEVSGSDTYGGSGIQVFHVDTTGNVILTHSLELGANVRDVYYVFTNVTASRTNALPAVSLNETDGMDNSPYALTPSRTIVAPSAAGIEIIRGSEEIDAFNKDPFLFIDRAGPLDALLNAVDVPVPLMDAAGDKVTFYDIDGKAVPATCRKVVAKDAGNGVPVTLNIFVADDCWQAGGTRAKLVDDTMVNAMADKFLAAGANNDIYDWLTNIFGVEWEAPPYAEFIGDTDEITILMYDIKGDNSTTGGYLGAFYSRDNVKKAYLPLSNQRIMFYIDAVLYATETDSGWDITDFWPEMIISTLAHEFQHMIHFYQKNIKRVPGAAGSEVWLNEMCSVMAEDFISRKLGVDGPRGVAYNEPGAGDKGNINGRLPVYNYYDDSSIMDWNTAISYSLVYSFGAYLARNYGGVTFFKNIVQNNKTDYTAVTAALAAGSYTDDFAMAMRKWGAAVVLSNSTAAPAGYRYNTGSWFTSTAGSIDYDLGSINFYNYKFTTIYGTLTGPYIYDSSPVGYLPYQQSASNAFFLVGENLSNTVKRTVKFEDNIRLTVVVVVP